jgi:hypothetical protein
VAPIVGRGAKRGARRDEDGVAYGAQAAPNGIAVE